MPRGSDKTIDRIVSRLTELKRLVADGKFSNQFACEILANDAPKIIKFLTMLKSREEL